MEIVSLLPGRSEDYYVDVSDRAEHGYIWFPETNAVSENGGPAGSTYEHFGRLG